MTVDRRHEQWSGPASLGALVQVRAGVEQRQRSVDLAFAGREQEGGQPAVGADAFLVGLGLGLVRIEIVVGIQRIGRTGTTTGTPSARTRPAKAVRAVGGERTLGLDDAGPSAHLGKTCLPLTALLPVEPRTLDDVQDICGGGGVRAGVHQGLDRFDAAPDRCEHERGEAPRGLPRIHGSSVGEK